MAESVITSEIVHKQANDLLERIARGEKVSAEERLGVIRAVFAFSSPCDWSSTPDLLLIFRIATLNSTIQ